MTPEFKARAGRIAENRVRGRCHPQVMRIIEQVAHATGYSVVDLISHAKHAALVEARDLAVFEAMKLGLRATQIARSMDRDHTSILAAFKRERQRRVVG